MAIGSTTCRVHWSSGSSGRISLFLSARLENTSHIAGPALPTRTTVASPGLFRISPDRRVHMPSGTNPQPSNERSNSAGSGTLPILSRSLIVQSRPQRVIAQTCHPFQSGHALRPILSCRPVGQHFFLAGNEVKQRFIDTLIQRRRFKIRQPLFAQFRGAIFDRQFAIGLPLLKRIIVCKR